MTRPGPWLGLALCVPFSAMMLVEWEEEHPTRKETIPLMSIGLVVEQVQEENPRGTS